mmetsp:Transcript_89306/g.148422  ORF Transcript_89306/g.148422 Transcript_89306/m.148422 type:complete len:205 (-) Transcript_89306:334-948(-)
MATQMPSGILCRAIPMARGRPRAGSSSVAVKVASPSGALCNPMARTVSKPKRFKPSTLSLMVLAVSVFLDSVAVSSGVLFCTAEDGPSVASVLEGHSVVDGCISAFSQEPLGDCVTLVTSVTAAGGTSPAGSFTAPGRDVTVRISAGFRSSTGFSGAACSGAKSLVSGASLWTIQSKIMQRNMPAKSRRLTMRLTDQWGPKVYP